MKKILSSFTMLMLVTVLAFAQSRLITGKILDEAGQPVAGASISIKGSTVGASADADGAFRINAKTGDVLVITVVGAPAKQVTVTTGSNLTVSLARQSQSLSEVVVTTALGIKRTSRSTGYSVATISTAQLTQARATNIANGLSGKVAGLQINTVNNGVNADTRIVLRGERSILGNNQALVVIDNVPVSASYLNSLNPDDVESVSVLKGPNAAALYGSDGANGVIIVTSKKGVRAKPAITFTHSTTIEKISFFPKLNTRFGAGSTEPDSLSGYTGFYGRIPYENQMYGTEFTGLPQALGYKKRFYRADGTAFDTTNQISYDYKNPLGSFFQTGVTTQNGINYQAGDQNGSFFFSGQFNSTTGTIPMDVSKRYSARLGSSRNFGKFSSSFSMGYTKFETNTAGTDYNQSRPVYWNVLNTPGEVPITNFKDPNAPFANENDWYNAYYPNPYWQLYNSREKTVQDDILGSLELALKATSWLNFTYRVGITARNFQQKNTKAGVIFSEYEIADPLGAGNTASGAPSGIKPTEYDYLSQRFIIQSDFLINLEHKFLHDDLNVHLLLGQSMNKNTGRALQTGTSTTGNQLEIPGLYNVSNVIGIPTVTESVNQVGKMGVYGSLQFGYKNFLFLELTGRNDWVSVLAPENRSYFYPGVNTSFIFTDVIKPLKNISWLSTGKLTASYTRVGNVSLGAYELSNTFGQAQGFPYNNLTGFTLNNTLANSGIKPEFITAKEAGVQLGLLKNRVNLGVTYYNNIVTDQTVPINISSSTGYTATNQNVGKVTNEGWEFELNMTPLLNLGPVRFNFSGNVSFLKDKVNEISPDIKSITIGGFTTGAIYTIEGQTMRVLQVRDYNRDSSGRVIVSPTTGRPSIATNLVNVGRSTPNLMIGLTPSLQYKGLTISALAEYRGGYTVYQQTGVAMAFTGVSYITTATGRQRFIFPNSSVLVNGKYEPNTSVSVDNASTGSSFWTSAAAFRGAGTPFITSGDAWKIREVSISWRVPVKGKVANVVKGLTLGFVARNLFTFLPKDNIYSDPEFNAISTTNQGTSGNAQGISTENLSPPTRIFGGTVSVVF